MAIKVKHEGNVTSRMYAAAAGGKGKRQAEDAKVLLAAQQRGNGGGGTGGGARAGGNAPTLSAPTSHATLGSTGQMLSPPSMSFNQRTQLQAQRDEAAKDRLISEQEWRAGEKELDRKHETTIKQSEIDNYNVQRDLDRQHRERLQKEELEWRANQTQKERDHKDSVLNRTMRREERSKLGFSADQILELEKIDADKVAVMGNDSLTKEEKELALLDLDRKAQEMMPLYPPQATAQQDFESSIVTDPNTGLRYRKTSRGDYELLETPKDDGAAAKAQARQAQKAWNDYQKFISDEVADAYGVAVEDEKPFDRAAAEDEAKKKYVVIYGAIPQDPNATPTPTPTPTPSPEGGSGMSSSHYEQELKRRGLIK